MILGVTTRRYHRHLDLMWQCRHRPKASVICCSLLLVSCSFMLWVTPDVNPYYLHYNAQNQAGGIDLYVPDTFLIEERNYCQNRPGLEIIAYVHSSISRRKKRDETRNTWANVTSYNMGINVGVVFVVGRAKDDNERQIILEESQHFHDIVQVDIEDDYHLLSYKGLNALFWILNHCSEVPWTLHADDDVLIDVFLLTLNLREFNTMFTNYFYCNAMYSKVMREGKWAVNPKDYEGEAYPTFCSGDMWVLPTRLIPRVLQASQEVPFLWVDDAYITGVLAKQANISRFPDPDGFGSSYINEDDIGIYHAWHSIEGDRRYWWDKIVYRYRKTKIF